MTAFLQAHQDWAFQSGLRNAWLRSLGRRQQWQALLRHAGSTRDAEIRCYQAVAKIRTGATGQLEHEIKSLWLIGKSQKDACDPAFKWLAGNGHITPQLSWRRIDLAMQAGNSSLARYLGRHLPADMQLQLDRYLRLMANPLSALPKALSWPDKPQTRDMLITAMKRLARRDADAAWRLWNRLDTKFSFSADQRGPVLHDIAVYSAVSLDPEAIRRLRAVPADYRDIQLLQWQLRAALAVSDWALVMASITAMPEQTRNDSRWRYWRARALAETGQPKTARKEFERLAAESHFHGFLAADRLALPYSLCPQQPQVDPDAIAQLRKQAGIQRALELKEVELLDFARREWQMVSRNLDRDGLRAVAALAVENEWHDRAIFALGDSGDRRYYEWRFPLDHQVYVQQRASQSQLDPAWIFGLMRSESAMDPGAISTANARGLMQVTPATARQLARNNGISYRSSKQLLEPEFNIMLGTVYLRELLDRFANNPYLVAGAYNAGPEAVERWLKERPQLDPDVWIELIPYFETRDYVPRVLAFTTIYDWRLNQTVKRVSSRMPELNGAAAANQTTRIVCQSAG